MFRPKSRVDIGETEVIFGFEHHRISTLEAIGTVIAYAASSRRCAGCGHVQCTYANRRAKMIFMELKNQVAIHDRTETGGQQDEARGLLE
ncbi:hypothetical protein GJ744_000205 [Endocarpon pusillum]|uniref:Uncharacterized protein n=1 Tax=Endocarpon pusillum TaxID=364733 RepID=A0A8H7EAB9_9EURO|nr:hypothetical protein GJ744_000205 [Endocarpon pusillum]